MPSDTKKNKNMDPQQQQLVDRIKQAQNVLITVSSSPSVDQLAAAIGLTLVVNKLDKHGTAVFSGTIPSTIDFLKPEETLEKNTDSLRDFIIALDKSKADKLRYKVEDDVVRIFITPYRTSINEKDLEFSQGDFNVDVVICLGVTQQHDLDAAITAHGRILHDATVVSVSTEGQGELGSINWVDPQASSLCEMVASLADALDKKAIDSQIATALLTGIVATTERFRNDKTTPKTMSASAELMSAGANQQLIASELETPAAPAEKAEEPEQGAAKDSKKAGEKAKQAEKEEEPEEKKPEPGTLEIDHEEDEEDEETPEEPKEENQPQIDVDEDGTLRLPSEEELPSIGPVRGVDAEGRPTESDTVVKRERITEPPKIDGDLTANTEPEQLDPPTEELSLPSPQAPPLLKHDEPMLSAAPPSPAAPQPAPADWQPPAAAPLPPAPAAPTPSAPQAPQPLPTPPAPLVPDSDDTLTEIEESVHSPHLEADDAPPAPDASAGIDEARNAVEAALNSSNTPADPLEPIAALNAQPLGPELQNEVGNEQPAPPLPPVANTGFNEPTPGTSPADETLDMPLPPSPFGAAAPANPLVPPAAPPTAPSAFPGAPQQGDGQTPPPPVPPPMLPPMPPTP